MRIFNVEREVKNLDGFKPELDIFNRAPLGAGLTHLVTSAEEPLVIALDADWGAGKTMFLKMWAGELRKLGIPVIYFDAYANDYSDDAFLALAGEIIHLAREQKKAGPRKIKTLTQSTVNVGKIILRSAGKITIKAATLGVLDGTEADSVTKEITDDIADETSALADRYLEQILTSADERKATLASFRQTLSELPTLLNKPVKPEKGEGNPYPLVFIIDELDRCVPPFALNILERVKHLFSVPNVHFVLGVHLDQLCNSVKSEYGSEIDARMYLEKFIHVTVHLVDTAEYETESVSNKYIELLSRELATPDWRSLELLNEFMRWYSNRTSLTLRGLQRIYATLGLALAVRNDRTLFIAPLVAGLAILKLRHPALYKKAKKGTLLYAEVEQIFGFDTLTDDERLKGSIQWAADFWRAVSGGNAPQDIVEKYARALSPYDVPMQRVLPELANEIIDRFKPS